MELMRLDKRYKARKYKENEDFKEMKNTFCLPLQYPRRVMETT